MHNQGKSSEILVVALIPNRRYNYGPLVVLAQGVCKEADASFYKRILVLVSRIWKEDSLSGAARGPLSTVQSDGASVLAAAGHATFDIPFAAQGSAKGGVAATSPGMAVLGVTALAVVDKFRSLALFPKYCGRGANDGQVDGRDGKHVGKRFKTRANTKTLGFAIASSFQYIRSFLRDLIKSANLASESELKEIFNEGGADAQKFPAMVKLIVALHRLKEKTPSDFPERDPVIMKGVFSEIRILSEYAGCFECLFLGRELSLEQHLDSLSTLAHLLLVLFRRNGTKFVPAQHYSNTQRMIRAHFWSVATAQVHEIDEYCIFLDSTDPLEQLIGIIRGLHGSGTEVDCVQFDERATAANVF